MHKSNTLTVHTRPRGLTRRETESERTKGNKNLFSGLLHEFLPHRNEKRLKMKIYKSQSARVKWGVLSRSYVLKGKNGLCKALVLVVCQAVLTIISLFVSHVISGSYFTPLFSRGHATLHLAVSVGWSVGRSHFLIPSGFQVLLPNSAPEMRRKWLWYPHPALFPFQHN